MEDWVNTQNTQERRNPNLRENWRGITFLSLTAKLSVKVS